MEKGDAQDRAFREKVYRQAFAALERSLQSRPELSIEDVRQRRDSVKAVIVEIENEFQPAVAPAPTPTSGPAPTPSPGFAEPGPEADFVPRVERRDRLSAAEEPAEDIGPLPPEDETEGRRRPFAMLFVFATLIAAVGIGAWWTLQSGILQPAEERGAGLPAPPLAEEEDFDPGNGAPRPAASAIQVGGDWITIFSPDDPTTIQTQGGASAEVMDEEEDFLRITGASGAAVSFDVGQGVLERLAGQRVIFNITASAQEGQETQISVSCDFGALGGCGRSRYLVSPSPTEYLLETELSAGEPGAGGTISIVPDVEGEGRTLDIFSVRVATAN
ncbi:hypothetical protein [Chelativorans salis]|uniref:Uncharacterized protein n=1 Tax=Chelativorans salis TaxID=2978478 RepID=A0ABT2LYW6_9HYPH|nr:hypothetical protein [Chelativorans sp. EGI FJ00035]MCT7378588.1 hypothetical protein [Chelativorans sp. EGI FJ00035]